MKKIMLRASAVLAILAGVVVALFFANQPEPPPSPVDVPPPVTTEAPTEPPTTAANPEPEPEPDTELHTILYQVGKFGPDAERLEYVGGEMILRIPRLDFEGPVLNGVDTPTLNKGVGLFDQAQLPGPENRNVSIAGHRDIYGKEFYYIDTITDGDYIYLDYKGKEYVYQFESSFIVTPDNWDPIRTKDYSCISLQSCTPINIASHRIFVVGRLVEINDLAEIK